jgi:hypothetical protein
MGWTQVHQGQGNTNIVVEVASRGMHTLAKHAGDHFLDRGLAGITSDRHTRRLTDSRHLARDLSQSLARISNDQLRGQLLHHMVHHAGHRAIDTGLCGIVMAIKTVTANGDEKITRPDLTAVDTDALERGLTNGTTLGQCGSPGKLHAAPPT